MRKYLLIFPVLLLTFFALKHISAPLFFAKEYRFIQTGLLSDDYLSSIKTYATQLLDDHYSAHTIITCLKKEFPVLDKIVVAYRPCGVYSLLCELPSDFNQDYNLEFINERHICLRSKQEKNFSIIACAAQDKLSCLLTQCAIVKKNISERKGFNEKAKWVTDVRFADYIIAYKV